MTRRVFFLVGLLIECIAVFGLLLWHVELIATGTPFTLQTAPIDPYSFLRGDFMALDYKAGQKAPVSEYGEVKYVTLQKRGNVFERVAISNDKPVLKEGQVCVKAVTQYQSLSFPDLSQYFIEEGTGMEFAESVRGRYLFVDAIANSSCRSVIKGVRVGEKIPASELQTPDSFPVPIDPPYEHTTASGAVKEPPRQ